MDNSVDIITNDTEDVTMGNILSSTNENHPQTSEANTNNEASNNGSENLEVRHSPNLIKAESVTFTTNTTTDTNLTIETDNNDSKTVGLHSSNIESNVTEPAASSSQESEKVLSNVDEHMDMWLDGKTCELVKDDNEEDFDVIVKSLETAIVETENYEPEPVVSSIISDSAELEPILDDSPMPSLIEILEQDEPDVVLNEEIDLSDGVNGSSEIVENIETVDERALLLSGESIECIVLAAAPQIDCVPSTEELDDDYIEQSTSLFETHVDEIDVVPTEPSLLEYQISTVSSNLMDENIDFQSNDRNDVQIASNADNFAITTCVEIDPEEMSDSSIISASTDDDNEEAILLNSTADSIESDFTLHLEEEQEIENSFTSKQNDEITRQTSQIEKLIDRNKGANENSDIQIISVTSIVDYDDSSEEEIFNEEIDKKTSIENTFTKINDETQITNVDSSININSDTLISEQAFETVETIEILKKNIVDEDITKFASTTNVIENVEKFLSMDIDNETKSDNLTVQKSKDKIEIIGPNTKDDSKIINVPIHQSEIILETKAVEINNENIGISNKDQIVVPNSKDIIEISEAELSNSSESEVKIDEITLQDLIKSPTEIATDVSEIEAKFDTKIIESDKNIPNQSIQISEKVKTSYDEKIQSQLETKKESEVEQKVDTMFITEKISSEITEEKPRNPPKKIKLIRQKLPSTLMKIETAEVKNVEAIPSTIKEITGEEVTDSQKSSPVPIQINIINEPIKTKIKELSSIQDISVGEKSDKKIQENIESDEKLFSDIFKIEEEIENKPVKIQKLKLKRNYQPPPLIHKPQVSDSLAKTTEVLKEPTKIGEIVKQPVKITDTIKGSVKIAETIKEPVQINVQSDEPVSTKINLKKELSTIDQNVSSIITSEEIKEVFIVTEKKDDLNIKDVVPISEEIKVNDTIETVKKEILTVARSKEEEEELTSVLISEEIIQKKTVTSDITEIKNIEDSKPENQEKIVEILMPIVTDEKFTEPDKVSVEIKDDNKIKKIMPEENLNSVKISTEQDVCKKSTFEINNEIINELEKVKKQNIDISDNDKIHKGKQENIETIQKLDKKMSSNVEEVLQVSDMIASIKTTNLVSEEIGVTEKVQEEAISENEIVEPIIAKTVLQEMDLKAKPTILEIEINDGNENVHKEKILETEKVEPIISKPIIEEKELKPTIVLKIGDNEVTKYVPKEEILETEKVLPKIAKTEEMDSQLESKILEIEEVSENLHKEEILEIENEEPIIKKVVLEKMDAKSSSTNLETIKITENLHETCSEIEKILPKVTDIVTKPETEILLSLPKTEEVNVIEEIQKNVADICVSKTERRAFETISAAKEIEIPEKSQTKSKEITTNIITQFIEIEDESNQDNLTPQIVNIERIKKKQNIELKPVEKIESVPITSVEKEKIESEPKKVEIQFPLLMSRLQDKLHSNLAKTSKHHETKSVKSIIGTQIESQKLDKNVLAHSTIEPEISNLKFRALKRRHETELAVRSITKPLTVEIDDLESSDAMMQPSEHENIPKLVIKQISKPEQRSSPKITIKPIKPPGSPEVSSKRSRMSEEPPNTPRLTIKPLIKPDSLKLTITKQKSEDTHSILKIYQPGDEFHIMDDTPVSKLSRKSIPKSDEMQHSPKITIKPVKPPGSPKVTVKPILPPSDQNFERAHSPKVTVKPVINPEETYPKITIKPVLKPEEMHKVTQISPRQVKLKSMTFDSSSGVTVEPICSTSSSNFQSEHENPMKISVKNFAKMEEISTPKFTIKPLTKTCEIVQSEDGTSNPLKLTIKPILKPEESYQSPKITIKPIVKPDDHEQHTFIEEIDKPERIILKIQKTNLPSPKERTSTHVRKDPDIKIETITSSYNPENIQKLDKIKLKLTKEGSHAQIIPSITTSHAITETNTSFSLKRSLPITNSGIQEKKQKSEFSELLHSSDISINLVEPHSRQNIKQISEEVTIMKIGKTSGSSGSSGAPPIESMTQLRLKEMLLKISQKPEITCTPHLKQIQQIQQQHQREDSSSSDDVRIVEVNEDPLRDPLNEDSSSQDVVIINEVIDTNPFKNVQVINTQTIIEPVQQQQYTPKKRGRPRKVPLEVRPEIKGEDCILSDPNNSAGESSEGGRPKRTCRAPAGRTPFAIKERKPRGSGRGRGSSRGARGAKSLIPKLPKEPKTPRGKALKIAKALAKLEAAKLAQEVVIDEITIEDSTNDTPANTPIPQAENFLKKPEMEVGVEMVEPDKIGMKISEISTAINEITDVKNTSMTEIKNTSVSVYEEETRMSASENNSRAQTPARQVFIVPLSAEGPEESQSSVQSSATTESTKNKKGRLEICDPDSAHTTVEQIVEYSWGNGGPYMLQEQIAQYLGVKSFKRKYPGLTRRPVDMQERDYIKEKGLVSESMCDMGLTAVPSSEILDIMYSDFQEKYEEYRKCLRDKQSKEISNKQKAISLATSQEKNKLDFKERAIRSTASWNSTFNKTRKDSRKSCMDLQTFTVNYPTGKNYPRVPYKTPVGSYPIALVPGQFTDYFKAYSPPELNYLPLNTVRFGPILPNQRCLDASDGSSESDSSSASDSDSSDESMSTDDEASSTPVPTSTPIPKHLHLLGSSTPKSKIN